MVNTSNTSLGNTKRKFENDIHQMQADLDNMMATCKNSEEEAKKAMVAAGRLADELCSEQDQSEFQDKAAKTTEMSLVEMQNKVEQASSTMARGAAQIPDKLEERAYNIEIELNHSLVMDATKEKIQSLKGKTDSLYKTIAGLEEDTRTVADRADQTDCDIRDYGKKVQQLEIGFDETNVQLTKTKESLKEADKQFKEMKSDVSALTRRIMLMEEEEMDTNRRATVKMTSDNEQELDELSKKLGVQETELKRAVERVKLAESKLKGIEKELETVGENMQQLEKSAEKALQRGENLVADPYKWMEDPDSEETKEFVRQQNKKSGPYISSCQERKMIKKELNDALISGPYISSCQ